MAFAVCPSVREEFRYAARTPVSYTHLDVYKRQVETAVTAQKRITTAKTIANSMEGVYKIIYVAPDRLFTPRFQNFAQGINISMVCVDEAHCVSQWGQHFRPGYLDIARFLETLPRRPVVGAFTATRCV